MDETVRNKETGVDQQNPGRSQVLRKMGEDAAFVGLFTAIIVAVMGVAYLLGDLLIGSDISEGSESLPDALAFGAKVGAGWGMLVMVFLWVLALLYWYESAWERVQNDD